MMGMGKPRTRLSTLSDRVLRKATQKAFCLKISSKTARPTHFEPKKPLKML